MYRSYVAKKEKDLVQIPFKSIGILQLCLSGPRRKDSTLYNSRQIFKGTGHC